MQPQLPHERGVTNHSWRALAVLALLPAAIPAVLWAVIEPALSPALFGVLAVVGYLARRE